MIWVEMGPRQPTNTFQHRGPIGSPAQQPCLCTRPVGSTNLKNDTKPRKSEAEIHPEKKNFHVKASNLQSSKKSQTMRNVCNISKTYTPCAHITNSSSSSLATQLGESLIQLAHMESCSAASRRIRPSPKRYGENEVETWSPPDCCTQWYQRYNIIIL